MNPCKILLLCVLSLFLAQLVLLQEARAGTPGELGAVYSELKAELLGNDFDVPIVLKSMEKDGYSRGEVYGIIRHPFETLGTVLSRPEAWCDMAFLHFNIKACMVAEANKLLFYSGRKFYQKPDDVYELEYDFTVLTEDPDFLHVLLTAEKGPLGTRNYGIELQAMPLDESESFVHFRYSYEYGFRASFALSCYLNTLARGKKGFTILRKDETGNEYVGGMRGVMERNAVRYYYTIQAFLDTLAVSGDEKWEARFQMWYDLTDRHREQLYEMDREEYLEIKRKELENHQVLTGSD